MRRMRRVFHVLLALSLIVNGSFATLASASPTMSNAMQHDATLQDGDSGRPCHEQPASEPAPVEQQEPAQHSCCDQGGCLCVLGMSTVAAVDELTSRDFPPQRLASVSILTGGHPQSGPALLLRPPIV